MFKELDTVVLTKDLKEYYLLDRRFKNEEEMRKHIDMDPRPFCSRCKLEI